MSELPIMVQRSESYSFSVSGSSPKLSRMRGAMVGRRLFTACVKEDVEAAKEIISTCTPQDLAYSNWNGSTALHQAAHMGNEILLSALLEAKAPVDKENHAFETPLHRAAANGHPNCILLLLKHGADVSKKNQDGDTALAVAKKWNHKQCITALSGSSSTSLGSSSSAGTPQDTEKAKIIIPGKELYEYCKKGDVNKINDLLAKATIEQLSYCTETGCTGLIAAASKGHINVVALLIQFSKQYKGDCGPLRKLPAILDINRCNFKGTSALHRACTQGHEPIVKLLLEEKANPNLSNLAGDTPLHRAVSYNHPLLVKLLLESGARVTTTDRNDVSPLDLAGQKGFTEIQQIIDEHCAKKRASGQEKDIGLDGASLFRAAMSGDIRQAKLVLMMIGAQPHQLNWVDEEGRNALHAAAMNGHCDVIALLAKSGVDIHAKTKSGDTPKDIAKQWGHLAAEDLIKHLSSGSSNLRKSYGSSLFHACREGDVGTLRQLLSGCTPSDLNYQADHKDSASLLHEAAKKGHDDVVEMLLWAGADVSSVDSQGNTPLHEAAANGHYKIVQQLLEAHADATATNKNGETALELTRRKGHADACALLSEAVCKTVGRTRSILIGQELLNFATNGEDNEMQEKLKDAPPRALNSTDMYGRTPLHLAALNGHYIILCQLLQAGINVHLKDDNGSTALHYAASNGHSKIVERLIEAGAEINTENMWGKTPVFYACSNNHINVVECLITHGCDLETKTRDGSCCLDAAKSKGHTKIVKLIDSTTKARGLKKRMLSKILSTGGTILSTGGSILDTVADTASIVVGDHTGTEERAQLNKMNENLKVQIKQDQQQMEKMKKEIEFLNRQLLDCRKYNEVLINTLKKNGLPIPSDSETKKG